ncbi:tautomerase family protein [Denitrobaculum tricleocarpae]|nr:tautomerase family protein [Denitrobaculum tricleocarpae]
MPLVRFSVPAALSAAKTRALADAVHDGLVATCAVPVKDRFHLISVFPPERMDLDPSFPDVKRTTEASVVDILFLEGRTNAQRADLFRHIAAGAMAAGFQGDDIMIALTENATTDWSLGYGRSYGDAHGASDELLPASTAEK